MKKGQLRDGGEVVYKYPKKLLSSDVDDVAVLAFICAFHLFN